MKPKDQTKAEQLLTTLYNKLILYNRPDFNRNVPYGSLSDIAFKDLNSQKVQGGLDGLSELTKECQTKVNGNLIMYDRSDGLTYLLKNERDKQDSSCQEIYLRRDLPLDSKLHAVAVEREGTENHSDSSIDIGIYLSGPQGNLISKDSFNYPINNRLLYSQFLGKLSDKVFKLLKELPYEVSEGIETKSPYDNETIPFVIAKISEIILNKTPTEFNKNLRRGEPKVSEEKHVMME